MTGSAPGGGLPRYEIDGRAATAEGMGVLATVNYGHFTAMQVRGGRVRGLAAHLARLDAASIELFGAGLDADLVRARIRHALGDVADASVRVIVFAPDLGRPRELSVLVAVRPPAGMATTPQALRSVPYQRPLAHIKHLGGFGQLHFGRLARAEGYDEALLTGPGGVVSEGAVTNVAFVRPGGAGVVWPDAPCLHGITMQLLEPLLPGAGIPSARGPVRLADIPSYAAAFVVNSQGIAPVSRIDDVTLPVDEALMTTLTGLYASVPWDSI
ncbi:branched-subunit amino acid aminotransferase/4-amino-4-deoxychorismate lyase [Thermocatellispora tengchongensis]|uniref:Branched-subunit amino acid aminotransferase/4-amino-4-deoxychorismate lyase n=1 Tax=Thermocatellispora tengchongensis TaxID=1073253 RepID=A0A840NXD9_9ACTN|nr:aminotransferase class IV family protein [Thermocatellispora tengchongensis]MBB5132178.1 branched-subunit amino acid aminotransferase/4-amino-4-deoxychorismate lyase [Thermocatellispora tengchongensis]